MCYVARRRQSKQIVNFIIRIDRKNFIDNCAAGLDPETFSKCVYLYKKQIPKSESFFSGVLSLFTHLDRQNWLIKTIRNNLMFMIKLK